MKSMMSVLKNNIRRVESQKNYVLVTLGITFATILLALFFTSRFEIKGNIAYVSSNPLATAVNNHLNIDWLKEAPPMSQLVMNRYDAVVTDLGNGEFSVSTIKNKEFEDMLLQLFKNPGTPIPDTHYNRKAASNVLGYLIMFLMLQGLFFMGWFTEDKEKRIFKRVASSPASIGSYLSAHSLFNIIMVFVPTMLVLIVCHELLGVNLGLSYGNYALMVAILSVLATSFALMMTSLIEKTDNVMAAASTLVVLTSILGGSFNNINTGSKIANKALELLPQKVFITMVQGLENGKGFMQFGMELAYLLGISLMMVVIGYRVCFARFRAGKY